MIYVKLLSGTNLFDSANLIILQPFLLKWDTLYLR